MTNPIERLALNNRRIIFPNFSGKIGRFNPSGNRSFGVQLSEAETASLLEDGWTVKYYPQFNGEKPRPYLMVRVPYGDSSPEVNLTTSRGSVLPLDQNSIKILDKTPIESADIVVRSYEWVIGDKSGVVAYLCSAEIREQSQQPNQTEDGN